MNPKIIAATVVVLAAVPAAQAQTVDQLLADHVLLGTELDRCKQMGIASTDDPRCKTARAAEQKRFFGNGQDKYTPSTPQVYPNAPSPDQTVVPKPGGSPPHG